MHHVSTVKFRPLEVNNLSQMKLLHPYRCKILLSKLLKNGEICASQYILPQRLEIFRHGNLWWELDESSSEYIK